MSESSQDSIVNEVALPFLAEFLLGWKPRDVMPSDFNFHHCITPLKGWDVPGFGWEGNSKLQWLLTGNGMHDVIEAMLHKLCYLVSVSCADTKEFAVQFTHIGLDGAQHAGEVEYSESLPEAVALAAYSALSQPHESAKP